MSKHVPEEVKEMRRMIANSREQFRSEVARLLYEGVVLAENFADAIGEVGHEDALLAWKQTFAKRLE